MKKLPSRTSYLQNTRKRMTQYGGTSGLFRFVTNGLLEKSEVRGELSLKRSAGGAIKQKNFASSRKLCKKTLFIVHVSLLFHATSSVD